MSRYLDRWIDNSARINYAPGDLSVAVDFGSNIQRLAKYYSSWMRCRAQQLHAHPEVSALALSVDWSLKSVRPRHWIPAQADCLMHPVSRGSQSTTLVLSPHSTRVEPHLVSATTRFESRNGASVVGIGRAKREMIE